MGFNLADYEPVEVRLAKFWTDHPAGRVATALVTHDGGQWVFRAELYREAETEPFASGYAQETETERGVNSTSAAENCETSAIGRALANAGYAPKGARPSREEMTKATRAASGPPVCSVCAKPVSEGGPVKKVGGVFTHEACAK